MARRLASSASALRPARTRAAALTARPCPRAAGRRPRGGRRSPRAAHGSPRRGGPRACTRPRTPPGAARAPRAAPRRRSAARGRTGRRPRDARPARRRARRRRARGPAPRRASPAPSAWWARRARSGAPAGGAAERAQRQRRGARAGAAARSCPGSPAGPARGGRPSRSPWARSIPSATHSSAAVAAPPPARRAATTPPGRRRAAAASSAARPAGDRRAARASTASRTVGGRPRLAAGQGLGDEERVAAGPAVERGGVERLAGGERRHRRDRERRQRARAAAAAEVARSPSTIAQRVARAELVVAVGQHEERRHLPDAAAEELDEIERGRVRPVQVLEHGDRRAGGGRAPRGPRRRSPAAARRRRGARAARPRPARRCRTRARAAAGCAGSRTRPTACGPGARRSREVLDERRLADSGLAVHERDASLAGRGLGQRGRKRLQRGLALQERHGRETTRFARGPRAHGLAVRLARRSPAPLGARAK